MTKVYEQYNAIEISREFAFGSDTLPRAWEPHEPEPVRSDSLLVALRAAEGQVDAYASFFPSITLRVHDEAIVHTLLPE